MEQSSITTFDDIIKQAQIVNATISKTSFNFSDPFEPGCFPTVEYHIYFTSEDGEIKYEHTWNFGLENYSSDRKELEADRIQMYYICKLLDTYDTTKFVGKHVKLVFADNKCTHLFGISNEIGNMFVIPDNLFIHNDLKDTDNLYSLSEVYSMIHYAKTTKNFIF